jgi:cell wall-associated NlpC family hydrolase
MITRDDIVTEAKSWIGTPYAHQGRRKGSFVDCVGLVMGVARKLDISDYEYKAYSMTPNPRLLRNLCDENLVLLGTRGAVELQPGNVLLLKWSRFPQHMGIVSSINPPYMIHAMREIEVCAEQEVNENDIVAIYDFPGVSDG